MAGREPVAWGRELAGQGRGLAWPCEERAARRKFTHVTICEHAHQMSADAQMSS